jgi:hypothetical protein
MPKRTDVKSSMIIGAGSIGNHYLFARFVGLMVRER